MTSTRLPARHPAARTRSVDHEPATGGAPQLSERAVAWVLLVGGLVGAAAALVLAVEKYAVLADPAYLPTCSINPVLSCGSIMESAQAEAFGFPNPLIGVAGFPVVAATGAALLGGARLPRWWWLGLQAGATLAIVFVGWLVFQSLYRIGALCPYCMVVWAVTVPVFWYVTVRNATAGVFGGAVRRSRAAELARSYPAVVVTSVVLVVVALVAERFWSYWTTLVP